jgi:2-oxoglutarate ferredoxin oxidoreductase subunit beta
MIEVAQEETKERYSHPLQKYFRKERFPTMFCPGCGNGIVMSAVLRAIDNLPEFDINNTVFVSGIGCSGRIPGYINADSVHTTHGRAIPVATGIKMFRPDLEVIVFGGDGDITAIGGNHLLHAARRHIDLTVICINNLNYGLTGGQFSPATPVGATTYTTPYGNIEGFFDFAELVASTGAAYSARWTTNRPHKITKSVEKALLKKGFAYVEVVSQCPTSFGRHNVSAKPKEFMSWLKKNSLRVDEVRDKCMTLSDVEGKLIIGEFIDVELPELTSEYRKLIEGIKDGTIKAKKPRLDWLELAIRA